jgi:hypothetical protein
MFAPMFVAIGLRVAFLTRRDEEMRRCPAREGVRFPRAITWRELGLNSVEGLRGIVCTLFAWVLDCCNDWIEQRGIFPALWVRILEYASPAAELRLRAAANRAHSDIDPAQSGAAVGCAGGARAFGGAPATSLLNVAISVALAARGRSSPAISPRRVPACSAAVCGRICPPCVGAIVVVARDGDTAVRVAVACRTQSATNLSRRRKQSRGSRRGCQSSSSPEPLSTDLP